MIGETPDEASIRAASERYAQWAEEMDREDKRLRRLAEHEIERRLRARERVPLKKILDKYNK